MKALTLWQPWATLIAIGAKRFETRSWQTSHRGPLAIHAAKKRDWQRFAPPGAARAILDAGESRVYIGCVLAVVRLIECLPTDVLVDEIDEQEREFGDWSPGRWAWRVGVVHRFDPPIPARGAQGLWGWTPPAEEFPQIEQPS